VAGLGRPAEMPLLGQHDEIVQVVEMHAQNLPLT
jgi:hypothetical protein